MTFTKRFNKFLKSEQCKMIGCIFLVLLASIMIKLSMPSTFEHLNPIRFVLKFKETPEAEFTINDFRFKINDNDGSIIQSGGTTSQDDQDIQQVSFDINVPTTAFILQLIPKDTSTANKITSFKVSGTEIKKTGDFYPIQIQPSNATQPIELNVT
jgi:hypothetical protein